MPLNPILLILAFVIIILIAWIIRLEIRLHRLLSGSDGKSLEGTIVAHGREISELEEHRREMLSKMIEMNRRLEKSVQTVRTIRFDPFGGTGNGGKQSFATALLDEHGDGVVFSSLYTREKVSVFAKPIEQGKSQYELTEEEKQAIG